MSSTKQSLKTTTLYNVIKNNFKHIMFIGFHCIFILFDFYAINSISDYFDSNPFANATYTSINSTSHLRKINISLLENDYYQKKYMETIHPEIFNVFKKDFYSIQCYFMICLFVNIFTLIFGYILNDIIDYFWTNLISLSIKTFTFCVINISNGKLFEIYKNLPSNMFIINYAAVISTTGLVLCIGYMIVVGSCVLLGRGIVYAYDILVACLKNTKIQYVEVSTNNHINEL